MKRITYFSFMMLLLQAANHSFSQALPTPTITLLTDPIGCSHTGIPLISSASSGNVWSNGATTQTIVVFTSGTYFVTQVAGSSTSAPSAPVTVTIYPSIHPTITPLGPFCTTSPPAVIQYTPSGGAIFMGTGVTAGTNGVVFDPSLANPGPNVIHLQLTQHYPGIFFTCKDTAATTVMVSICDALQDREDGHARISVYPTVFSKRFSVICPEDIKRICIKDIGGREIYTVFDLNQKTIELNPENLTAGIYIVEVCFGSEINHSRIVKVN